MAVKVRKNLKVLNGFRKQINVKVGYPEETTGSDTYSDGTPLAENAATQVYGDPQNEFKGKLAPIPPRDFMGEGGNNWSRDWAKNQAGREFVESVIANSPDLYIDAIGVSLQGFIREAFTATDWPPNSPVTIKMKRSSQPLIDSGKLRQSVDYVGKIKE